MKFFRYIKRKLILIDAGKFTDKAAAHRVLSAALLPGQPAYGPNLDALHDVLTSIGRDVTIRIRNFGKAEKNLGDYAKVMRRVFADSAMENHHLNIIIAE